jgi:hypothetical protein
VCTVSYVADGAQEQLQQQVLSAARLSQTRAASPVCFAQSL